jgi:hypothetical protein
VNPTVSNKSKPETFFADYWLAGWLGRVTEGKTCQRLPGNKTAKEPRTAEKKSENKQTKPWTDN